MKQNNITVDFEDMVSCAPIVQNLSKTNFEILININEAVPQVAEFFGIRGQKGQKGDPGEGIEIDPDFSHEGAAADAKAVGDKLAIIENFLSTVASVDENGNITVNGEPIIYDCGNA